MVLLYPLLPENFSNKPASYFTRMFSDCPKRPEWHKIRVLQVKFWDNLPLIFWFKQSKHIRLSAAKSPEQHKFTQLNRRQHYLHLF